MDSPHIGSDTLVYIQTDKLIVTVKGNTAGKLDTGITTEKESDESFIKVFCQDDSEVFLCGEECQKHEILGMQSYLAIYPVEPLFFEQQNYEIIIESLQSERIEFWHDNYHIRNKITPVGHQAHILSGVINFGNEIGFSDFIIRADGQQYLKLVIEVFPSKLDYKEDYQNIIADVTQEVYNLAFDFLKKTYHSYQQDDRMNSSPVEFFAVLRRIYQDFLRASDMILAKPHHILDKAYVVMPAHKIKRVDQKSLRWIERHPESVQRNTGKILLGQGLSVQKQITYDTRENRLIKYMLEQTIRKLAYLQKVYQRSFRQTDIAVINQIDRMMQELSRRCTKSFLYDIEASAASTGMSLVFSMAPGYRNLYKYYLMLMRGLSIHGDVFNISMKDMAVLYEYWCFIKLNRLLKDRYMLVSQDIISVQGNGLFFSLVKGFGSHVKYRNPISGEIISLAYNPKEVKLPTITQRPDNVLSLTKAGADIQYEYVFDAKYRINRALPGTVYFETIDKFPGPEVDDINTMHRYRDAIVYQNKASSFERTMFGAYVLFPYNNEVEYQNHRFYKSIEKVNIGGLPFLPSATGLVTSMLEDLISDSPESAFERATLPRGIEKKLVKIDWSIRDVMVGALSHVEQLECCKQHLFYHIPVSRLDEKVFPIRYVALYQSKRLFGRNAGIRLYGEVTKCMLVKRSDIYEIPKISDELYYRFEVKEWKILSRPIMPKEAGFGVRLLTNMFLLQHSLEVPELLISSEVEYRLYSELKRLMNHMSINDEEENFGFKFNGKLIVFEDGEIKIYDGNRIAGRCAMEYFSRYPRAVVKQFRKQIAGLKSDTI